MENETEFDLRDLLKIIKKRIKLIIIITLLFAFTSAVVSVYLISPIYKTNVGIIIGKQQNGEKITNSDVTMYQNLMQTYKNIALTNMVAQAAADKLGNGQGSRDIIKRTTVTIKEGTMILNIEVKSNSPEESYKDVQAYADAFVERANNLIPGGDVKIMDNARIPETPASPNVILNTAIAFIAGLFVSNGIVFLLEYMNNTLITKEDVKKYLELTIIGFIPENNVE